MKTGLLFRPETEYAVTLHTYSVHTLRGIEDEIDRGNKLTVQVSQFDKPLMRKSVLNLSAIDRQQFTMHCLTSSRLYHALQVVMLRINRYAGVLTSIKSGAKWQVKGVWVHEFVKQSRPR